MNVWDFKIESRDDLLVWADLWEDHGAQAHAAVTRQLHRENRWPSKDGQAYCWYLHSFDSWNHFHTVRRRRASIPGYVYGIPHTSTKTTVRRYRTLTTAFFDLVICGATLKEVDSGTSG